MMRKKTKKIVLVFGTFDGIHDGHRYFLCEAKKLGHSLFISLAQDSTVLKFKGKKPRLTLSKRKANLSAEKLADKIVAGDKKLGNWSAIKKWKPDIVALGYDQKNLGKALKKTRKNFPFSFTIKTIKPFKPEMCHSSILKAAT